MSLLEGPGKVEGGKRNPSLGPNMMSWERRPVCESLSVLPCCVDELCTSVRTHSRVVD